MNNFVLDERLANDCHRLTETETSLVLLMNNALLPWFILVPKTTETELIDLPVALQAQVMDEVRGLAGFVRTEFQIDKLNIAAIGNIVRQLHIHVVGRREGDYCWPGVVWGAEGREAYTTEAVNALRDRLLATGW